MKEFFIIHKHGSEMLMEAKLYSFTPKNYVKSLKKHNQTCRGIFTF